MRQTFRHSMKYLPAAMLACALAVWPMGASALAGAVTVTGGVAKGEQGDGTMNAAAAKAMLHGPLPASPAFVAAKAAANRTYDEAIRRRPQAAPRAAELEAVNGTMSLQAPTVLTSMGGRSDPTLTPPDSTGAAGPTRYVQLVNSRFGIVDRATNTLLAGGTLNRLAGFGSAVFSFDPQIIWDPTTNRFYYAMDSIVSASDNRIAFGFSKSASPSTASDWCKYSIDSYGADFPDFPKLGDNRRFILIGVNVFGSFGGFIRSDLIAMPKPIGTGVITTCPAFAALENGRSQIFLDLRDSDGNQVYSPTPANEIDTISRGYAVAQNLTPALAATKLWIVPVTGPSTGRPLLLASRGVTIPEIAVPAAATQPTFAEKLDTSDTRPTQAVLAKNPQRSNTLSLWTQQTVAYGSTGSQVRYYEIRPDLDSPILQRSGSLAAAGAFLFNAAISPDRRIDGTTIANGRNFVIGYSVSSPSINPRIVMGSSVNGAAVTFKVVKNGSGPYRDASCNPICRWGDYSGAAPDPRPVGSTRAVALTNQFSPGGAMPATQANWRTWIWFAAP